MTTPKLKFPVMESMREWAQQRGLVPVPKPLPDDDDEFPCPPFPLSPPKRESRVRPRSARASTGGSMSAITRRADVVRDTSSKACTKSLLSAV